MEKKLKFAGFIYALYIENQFIEYFKTYNDAEQFCKNGAVKGDPNIFIKPVAYFEVEKDG